MEKAVTLSSGRLLVLDDEKYFAIDPVDIPGRKYYHSTKENNISKEKKFRGNRKFFKKYPKWQAIDEYGHVSNPFIFQGTMKSETCLK